MPFITPSAPPPSDAAVYRVMVNVPREWQSIIDGLWLNNIFPSAFDESGIGPDAAADVMNNFYGEYLVTDFCGAMAVCLNAVATIPYDELPPGQQELYDAFALALQAFGATGGGGGGSSSDSGSGGVIRCQRCGTTQHLQEIIGVDAMGNIIINNGCGCGSGGNVVHNGSAGAVSSNGAVLGSAKYNQPVPGGVDMPLASTVNGTTDLCRAAITLANSSRTRMAEFLVAVNANVTAGQTLADSFRGAATTVPGIGPLFEWEDAIRDVWEENIVTSFEVIEDALTADNDFELDWFVRIYNALNSAGYQPGDNITRSVIRDAAFTMPIFFGSGASLWSPRAVLPPLVQALNMERVNRDMQLYPSEYNENLCNYARGQLGLPVASAIQPVTDPPLITVEIDGQVYTIIDVSPVGGIYNNTVQRFITFTSPVVIDGAAFDIVVSNAVPGVRTRCMVNSPTPDGSADAGGNLFDSVNVPSTGQFALKQTNPLLPQPTRDQLEALMTTTIAPNLACDRGALFNGAATNINTVEAGGRNASGPPTFTGKYWLVLRGTYDVGIIA